VCSIIIIGANEFENTILTKANRLKNPFPQIHSRLKLGGIVRLLQIPRKEVNMVCKSMSITDGQVMKYLSNTASNMRELEGAIKKLLRESQAEQCKIDMAFTLEVL
jgi:chromosomal replication initiation ATPase DnaA